MKRDYLALWALLAVAFVIFFALSVCGDISIGPVTIKASALADCLKTDTIAGVKIADSAAQDSVSADTLPVKPVQTIVGNPADTTGVQTPLRVLIIGDSMLEGLAPRLAAYCDASGYELYSVIWYSSTSEIYANAHLLTRYIQDLHPDYIFLSLGGNELFVRDIIDKRTPCVKSIIAEIGDIPYLWIGPPNWKPDTGINQLISENALQGCYFKSDGMHFDRKKDGAHPTQDSAVEWMDSIMRWMPDNAHYRLAVEQPKSRTARPKKQYMHKPGPTP